MVNLPEAAAFDRAVRPLLQRVLPDKSDTVLNYRADPILQARIEVLAEKSTQGELTAEERGEYEGYVRANKFIALLQRQTRHLLETPS